MSTSKKLVFGVMGPGEGASKADEEVAFALGAKTGRPVVLLNATPAGHAFWHELAGGRIRVASDMDDVIRVLASPEPGTP